MSLGKHGSDNLAESKAYVSLIISLECDDVVVVAALEHLPHRREVDAQRDVPIATEVVEAVRAKQQSHERHVARVLRRRVGMKE